MESSAGHSPATDSEAESVATLENPFKLIKVKGNREGLSLGKGLQPFASPTSSTVSPTRSLSPSLSPSSPSTSTNAKVIALNPFSLSRLQKAPAPLNGSCMARVSPSTVGSGLGKEVSEQLITDLQNEVETLKKEIESKDAKLTSSMRSIKTFWSPELKKERAGRKEDIERLMMLKNQYDVLSADAKKKSSRMKELENELEIERVKNHAEQKLLSKEPEIKPTDTINDEIKNLQKRNKDLAEELSRVQGQFSEAQKNFELKIVELSARDSLIKSLKSEIEEWKSQDIQQKLDLESSGAKTVGEIERFEKELKSKEENNQELCKTIRKLEEDVKANKESLEEKMLLIQNLEIKTLEAAKEREVLELKYQQEELECKSLSCLLDKKGTDVESMKNEVERLRSEIETGRTDKAHVQQLMEELKENNTNLMNDLEKLREDSSAKEQDHLCVKNELSALKLALEEKDKFLNEKQQMISSMKASRRRESVEAEDLKGVLDGKNREIESLNKKYETLDTYLSHRETALSHAREELAEIKSKHGDCSSTISFMESQITDKDQLISRLEKQRNRLEKEKEDEVSNVNTQKDQIEVLNKQSEDKDDMIKDLESKIEVLKSRLKDSQNNSQSQSILEEKEKKLKSLEEELSKSEELVNKLEKELDEKKGKEEQDKSYLKISDDATKRNSGTSPVKDSKMIKQLWDEISKKDIRMQDLEKQLKERGKQIANLRKTQTAEREKQAQYFTDKNKLEDESQNKYADLQGDLLKKDDRITMLEDALRESVSIAAEREELLAQHVELSEGASQTINQLEAEVDRITMEKGITNIKNAFLILSLGERDAVVSSLKSLRKRNLEELMNIKQTALLAAISEKDANIALLELQSSSKTRKQEIKQLKQEKDKLVTELKEQTQHRITITNNEENKDGMLFKDLEDAPVELVLQALRNLSDSSDKLEYYIDALLSFVKDRNLEILKEVPSLQKRNAKGIDKIRNAGKTQLLREMQKLEEDCSQLKSFVDILLEKLEAV